MPCLLLIICSAVGNEYRLGGFSSVCQQGTARRRGRRSRLLFGLRPNKSDDFAPQNHQVCALRAQTAASPPSLKHHFLSFPPQKNQFISPQKTTLRTDSRRYIRSFLLFFYFHVIFSQPVFQLYKVSEHLRRSHKLTVPVLLECCAFAVLKLLQPLPVHYLAQTAVRSFQRL